MDIHKTFGCVYRWYPKDDPTKTLYVGSSMNVWGRISSHKTSFDDPTKSQPFHNGIREVYGSWDKIDIELLHQEIMHRENDKLRLRQLETEHWDRLKPRWGNRPIADPEKSAAYQKAYQKAYRVANREEIAAYQKTYYDTNREKRAAYQKEYYVTNCEERKAYQREYYQRKKAEKLVKKVAAEVVQQLVDDVVDMLEDETELKTEAQQEKQQLQDEHA